MQTPLPYNLFSKFRKHFFSINNNKKIKIHIKYNTNTNLLKKIVFFILLGLANQDKNCLKKIFFLISISDENNFEINLK